MIDEHAALKDASYDEATFWTRGMQQADVRVEPMTVLSELDEEEESPCCLYEQLHHESKFGCTGKEQQEEVEEKKISAAKF
jgi:hypothetical protein